MTTPRARFSFKSLQRILPLVVVLGIVVFFAFRVSQHGIPLRLSRLLLQGSRKPYVGNQVRHKFSDTQIDSVHRAMAGFWVHTSTTPVRMVDRLELKENGIIWQQVSYRYMLPDSTSQRRHHMMHAYVKPYGTREDESYTSICNAILIRQIWFSSQDTCYGSSNDTLMWQLRHVDDTLWFEDRAYVPYSGTLDTFFLTGAVDLVDSVGIGDCPRGWGFTTMMKKDVLDAVSRVPFLRRTRTQVRGFIDRWYRPLVVLKQTGPLVRNAFPDNNTLRADITITASGRVTHIELSGVDSWHDLRKKQLRSEMGEWRFPPADSATDDIIIRYRF